MLLFLVQATGGLNEALQRRPLCPGRRYLGPTLKSFDAFVLRADLLSAIFLAGVYAIRRIRTGTTNAPILLGRSLRITGAGTTVRLAAPTQYLRSA